MDLAERQLELIAKLAALDPTPSFMGGYAEDALLAGTVTRPHEDVDLIFPRDQQELRMAQLSELGFTSWETWGEAAPGVPFYLFGQSGDLKLDLGVLDQADGHNWMRVHKPIPPLALYQMRAAVAERNSFGPLSERQLATMAQLRERFFPESPDDELLPPSEPLRTQP